MRHFCRTAVLLLGLVLCGGCGNQQKADLMLTVSTMVDQPAVPRSLMRVDVAKLLAALRLNQAQAAQLKQWAETDGKAIRDTLHEKAATVAALEAKLSAVADEFVRTGADDKAKQDAVAARVLGDDQAVVTEDDPPFDVSAAVAERATSLLPMIKRLDLRQRQVVLGGWEKVSEGVAGLMVLAEEDGFDSARAQLVSDLVEAQGYGFMATDEVTAKAREAVDRVPTGQAAATGVEAQVLALFKALPPSDAEAQHEEVASTLATFLTLAPAAELLALVP